MNAAEPAPEQPTSATGWRVGGIVMLVPSALLWAAAFVQVIFVVPRIERIFLDFKMILPDATQLVFSRGVPWTLIAFVVWVALACASMILCRNQHHARVLLALLILLGLMPLLFNLFLAASLYLPLMDLLEGLGGGNKK